MVESVVDYAIFMLDPSGVILSWNKGVERLKGYTADEVIGRHFSIFYPPELLHKNWPAHELAVALSQGRYEEEGWRLRKDGTRFWANVVITRLDNADGSVRGYSKVTRDLSERQRQEEHLRASEERFRLLVDGVKDYAIFMLDPSGHVVSWNTGARANKGYEAHEIIGKHFSVFYPEEALASGFPAWELSEAKKVGRYEDEGWRVRKDGSRFWANVVITALFDHTGQHRGFAKVTRDLTERRKVSALEDEGRRVQGFLALLGHELRNPLAPIANAAELLLRTEATPTVQRMTGIIQRQLRQMTRLVDDLLDVGRITSGKIQLEKKPVLLEEVVRESVETCKPGADAKRQSLRVSQVARAWVEGDRARLIQVVCNLLVNAIKFTPADGQVWLTTTLAAGQGDGGGRVEISVRDNGPGILPEVLPRVFDMFEQGPQDLSRPQGGLGLGLTLVQQIVQLHGGDVLARSRGVPGEGAEFVVRLPAAAPAQDARQGTAANGVKSILVVDDVEDSAETLSLLVQSMGYEVARAADGPAALALVKSQRPDLVLLDIGLPGMSGWEVAERIRMDIVRPPLLVAVTGYGQGSDRHATAEAGFYAHMTKPLDPAALERLLKKALE